MRSIGIDLARWTEKNLLTFHATRPNLQGLESHLARLQREVERAKPDVVVVDPISNLASMGNSSEVHSMLLRLVDMLKARGITVVVTSLDPAGSEMGESGNVISSLIDTWLVLRDIERDGATHRSLKIRKSRGMGHSNLVRGFRLTDNGIELIDPAQLGDEGSQRRTARKGAAS